MSEGARGLRVLVTGAASGIGAATVARLRRDGARVAGVDRSADALAHVALDARAGADVAVWPELQAAVDACSDALGGLDAAVACAGIAGRGTVADTEPDDWERIFAVNVRGVYLTARAVMPHLRRSGGGAIVNVASQLGLVAAANAAAYCASKGAVVQLTRAMAIDHGHEGIRVNCVCPGPTDTPLLEPYFAGGRGPERASGGPTSRPSCTAVSSRPRRSPTQSPTSSRPRQASTMGAALVVDGGYTIR